MARPKKNQEPETDPVDLAFLEAACDAGCPQDQAVNFLIARVYLQPKQLEASALARLCDYRCPECEALIKSGLTLPGECKKCGPTMIGNGGARAGAKSHWMFSQICCDDAIRYPALKILYLRKSISAAREQIRGLFSKICGVMQPKPNFREQAGLIEFANGSYVIVRHFKDESEIANFIGQEYDVIAIEELTTLTHTKFEDLRSCLRTSKPNWRPRLYATWNWGGVGHRFVMDLFYLPWDQKRESNTRYILSTMKDNKHVQPEYEREARNWTGWKYQAWYLGDPHISAGTFFTNWREDINVYPNEITHPNETEFVRWFASMDYGFTHPNCFHLFGEDPAGRFYTVGEYHQSKTLIADHADNFRDLLRLHNLSVDELDFIAAGRDCFAKDKDGKTVASEYEENGITLTPVQIDRVNAWSQMQERIGDVSRGIMPRWFVHRSCYNLIQQIPLAQHDEKKPGDVMKMNADPESEEGGDDALDGARGGIVMAIETGLKEAFPATVGSYQAISSKPEARGGLAWEGAVLIGNGEKCG